MKVTVALGADRAGYLLKEHLKGYLTEKGYDVIDCGTESETAASHYPEFAKAVCDEIIAGNAERGILCCGTGIGMSIAANKMPGIRAAVVSEHYSCRYTRLHNDSQVLCLGARVIGAGIAEELADIFLTTEAEGGRHAERVAMIMDLERGK